MRVPACLLLSAVLASPAASEGFEDAAAPQTPFARIRDSLWSAAGFNGATTWDLPVSNRDPWRFIDLVAVRAEGSSWSNPEIEERLRLAGEVLAQCRVGLGQVYLVSAVLPGGRGGDIGDETRGRVETVAAALPTAVRPVLFFVDRARPIDPASNSAWSFTSGFMSIFPVGTAPRAELTNTAWITDRTREPDYVTERLYSVEAHELTHLLLNEGGHLPVGSRNNLMSPTGRDARNVLTLYDQCPRMRASPLTRPAR